MTHVVVRSEHGRAAVLIDGVDVGPHIMREGFRIEPGDNDDFRVTMTVVADSLDADLPVAVIDALVSDEAAR